MKYSYVDFEYFRQVFFSYFFSQNLFPIKFMSCQYRIWFLLCPHQVSRCSGDAALPWVIHSDFLISAPQHHHSSTTAPPQQQVLSSGTIPHYFHSQQSRLVRITGRESFILSSTIATPLNFRVTSALAFYNIEEFCRNFRNYEWIEWDKRIFDSIRDWDTKRI